MAPTDRRFRVLLALLLAIGGVVSCRDLAQEAVPPGTPMEDSAEPLTSLGAAEAMARLEERMIDRDSLQVQFIVVSEGALASELRGSLALLGEGLLLSADGTFGGAPQTLRLDADGRRVRVGEGPDSTTVPQPAGLRESVVIGFTRMGILHNLARLTGGATPDRMEGGVREWVRVDSLAWGPAETVEGREATPLDFVIFVEGARAGTGRLYIDSRSDMPLRRTQIVEFPGGSMNVTESYEIF